MFDVRASAMVRVSPAFSVTVAPDGQSRVINAPCAITQNLGDARNDGLRVAKVSWLQVVEQDATDADARLTGGKPLRVRVDVLASTSGVSRPATRQLQVFNPATSSCTTITLSAPATVPTSANQEDHVSMAAHGARRLSRMNANLSRILGVEALCAAQGVEFRAPLTTSAPLARVLARLRQDVATLGEDRYLAPDLEAAAALVAADALSTSAAIPLPCL